MNNLFGRMKLDLSCKVHVDELEMGFASIFIMSCLLRGLIDLVRVQNYANISLITSSY